MLVINNLIDRNRKLSIEEVTEYILAIPKFAEKIGTEDLRKLMKELGDPQDKPKTVHVAGTNGKGSTTEMLRLMLSEAGYRTGSFTSPHLVRINERIAIDGEMISDEDFIRCFRTVIEAVNDNGLRHPSFFEFIFAMAAVYFAEQKVDYVVYETGMGGRLDATNIITPVVSVITSIGMDHMQYLGDTIEKIAFEKAGIIKPGVPVVHNAICHDHNCSEADKKDETFNYSDVELKNKAADVIKKRADELDSDIYIVDVVDADIRLWIDDTTDQAINNPALAIEYQKENASTAKKAFELIYELSYDDKKGSRENPIQDCYSIIKTALNKFSMPARMEKLRDNVIIDGAHNTDAMPQFLAAARDMVDVKKPEKVKLIFAVSNDKDYPEMVRMICDAALFDEIYLTTFNSYRKTDVQSIAELFAKYNCADKDKAIDDSKRPIVRSIPALSDCLKEVLGELKDNVLLFTAGSLYLAGEIEALYIPAVD